MPSLWTIFHLAEEFFQIGLFSFGGGYATLPFLLNLTHYYSWFTSAELSQMIAVATITPGPVAINVATYAGMKAGGIFAAFVATTFEILPAFIITLSVAKLLKIFNENFYVKSALWALKPAGCALLFSVAIHLIQSNILTGSHKIVAGLYFLILLFINFTTKKDPLFYIGVSAIVGILLIKTGII